MSIKESLKKAGKRCPDGSRAEKKNYAERFSRALSQQFANMLRSSFPGILPTKSGKGQESQARTAKGYKKLDVNYSTPALGLGLGVSIKTLNYVDGKSARYTKNYTRIDNELRAEANDYHERQPYSVLVAVVFLPVDSCDDGAGGPSSFGQAVKVFRTRAKREKASDLSELMEKVYIGAYVPDGENAGDVWFFDVENAPPKNGQPKNEQRLNLSQLITNIQYVYDARNNPPFEWAQ